MLFLTVGDSHGNIGFIRNALRRAQDVNAENVTVLGDFGYNEAFRSGIEFLDKVAVAVEAFGIPVYFIDGNHDNHPMLWGRYAPDRDGMVSVRDGLFYIPRGHCWSWGGKKFGALGGAWSINKAQCLEQEEVFGPGTRWWPTEMIRWEEEELMIANADGHLDIFLTHDSPQGVPVPNIAPFESAEVNRMHLRMVVIATLPELLVHGHYHKRYSYDLDRGYHVDGELRWHRTRVEGLGYDGSDKLEDAFLLVDTDNVASDYSEYT